MRRSFNLRFPVLAAACALALVAAGCGDDGGESGGDPKSEITTALEESLAFEDPVKVCDEFLSDSLLEEDFRGEDRDAWVEDCSDQGPGGFDDVEVVKVEVDGDTATARVSILPEGEDETATLDIDLVEEDGWKIDSVD